VSNIYFVLNGEELLYSVIFGHLLNVISTKQSLAFLLKGKGKQNKEIFVVYRKYATGSRILHLLNDR